MKLSTKLSIGGAISIALLIGIHQKKLIEHQIKRQIVRRFKDATNASIYGTWMRKLNSNPFDHHYHGGINVKVNEQLYQYRFTTNQWGKIRLIKLINRGPYPELES